MAKFDQLAGQGGAPLATLLPKVLRAGEDAGQLTETMAAKLGLPAGIPVAPAEGDQPASQNASGRNDASRCRTVLHAFVFASPISIERRGESPRWFELSLWICGSR